MNYDNNFKKKYMNKLCPEDISFKFIKSLAMQDEHAILMKNEELKEPTSKLILEENEIKGLVIMKKVFGQEIELDKPVVFESEDFKIYRLE